jgi:hypothetical protein
MEALPAPARRNDGSMPAIFTKRQADRRPVHEREGQPWPGETDRLHDSLRLEPVLLRRVLPRPPPLLVPLRPFPGVSKQ